jgi:SsrA-binding protein
MVNDKAKLKKAAAKGESAGKVIAQNRKARHEYDVLDSLECGIMLVGSEVKSLRGGRISLEEAHAKVRSGEVWLIGCDIPEYSHATHFNHDPKRPRKLLMHRREVKKFAAQAYERGLTLVPLKLYFNDEGRAKLLLGLCRGRKLHDKREVLKKADAQRDIARAVRRERG